MATTTAYPVSNSGVRVLSRSSWPKGPHPLLRHILSTGIGQDLANHPEAQVNCASPNRRNERLSNERAAALIGWSAQVRLSRDRRPRPVLPRIGPVQWHGTLAPHNPGVATAKPLMNRKYGSNEMIVGFADSTWTGETRMATIVMIMMNT